MDQVTIIPPPSPIEHLSRESTAESDSPTPVSPTPQSNKLDATATAATGAPAAITATAPYVLDTTATAHAAIPNASAEPAAATPGDACIMPFPNAIAPTASAKNATRDATPDPISGPVPMRQKEGGAISSGKSSSVDPVEKRKIADIMGENKPVKSPALPPKKQRTSTPKKHSPPPKSVTRPSPSSPRRGGSSSKFKSPRGRVAVQQGVGHTGGFEVERARIPRDMWNEEDVAGRVMAMLNDA